MTTVAKSERLKCRLCSYSCLRWRRDKDGHLFDGYDQLRRHFYGTHDEDETIYGASVQMQEEVEAEVAAAFEDLEIDPTVRTWP